MNRFTLLLQDAIRTETVDGVSAFAGADASGSFSLWAGHEHFMTVLETGLARFRRGADDWRYLALPGALLTFRDNVLTLSTRRYLCGDDYRQIGAALREQLLAEEANLRGVKSTLRRMEELMLKQLYEAAAAAE